MEDEVSRQPDSGGRIGVIFSLKCGSYDCQIPVPNSRASDCWGLRSSSREHSKPSYCQVDFVARSIRVCGLVPLDTVLTKVTGAGVSQSS